MKRDYYLILLLTCILACTAALAPSKVSGQTWTPKQTQITSGAGGYYEYLPAGYDGVKNFPLIVFLHGIGEQGNGTTDLYKIPTTGLPQVINMGSFPSVFTVGGQNFSFIVIAPQFSGWPTADQVNNVINYVTSNYKVDANRIYLTGLSMGGGVVWDHASSAPARASRLAAIVPICGASSPNNYGEQVIANAGLPVLATHNNDDGIVTVGNTIGWVDGINSFSPAVPAVKVIWPYGGHNAWNATYDPSNKFVSGMNVYEWMLQYKRGTTTPPPPPPPPALSASISSSSPVSCNGLANGSATVAASGGTSPYTYSWNTSPVQTGATASGLAAGTYTVTVKDAANVTATATVTIAQPQPLVLTVTPGTITTNGGTTNVSLSASGGTSPYSYSGPTSNVSAGTYTYTVTDAKGCTNSKNITITQPAPVITQPLAIFSVTHTDVTCNGSANGKASVGVTGGVTPYTYSWNSSPAQSASQATGLRAGTYTVTVTDAAGTRVSSSVVINEPLPLTLQATAGTIAVNGGTTSVTLNANGGTSPYTYTGTTTGLRAGTYSFSVTDANTCSASTSVTINEPPKVKLTARPGTIKCKGGTCNVALSVEGGVAPYSYTGDTVSLKAGSYTYMVTDANGATASATVSITEPDELVLQASGSTISKIGGTTDIDLKAVGGTAPYAYTGTTKALRPGQYNYEVKDANGCTNKASVEVKEPGVTLSAFTLSTSDTTISLNWNTSYEYAIDRFEVEKAKDDKSFIIIGGNKSKGNGQVQRNYIQRDESEVNGSNSYKLYAVTSFGERVYLGEKRIYFNEKGNVVIRNMVNMIDITVTSNREEKVVIMLFDALGRPVNQVIIDKSASMLRKQIPMDNLKSGVYIVKVSTASGMQSVKQVVKP